MNRDIHNEAEQPNPQDSDLRAPAQLVNERQIDQMLAIKAYLGGMANMHDALIHEARQHFLNPQSPHPSGLPRNIRDAISKTLENKLKDQALSAGISPEQHALWCQSCLSYVLRANHQTFLAALSQPPSNTSLRLTISEILKTSQRPEIETFCELLRINPIAAFTGLYVWLALQNEDSNIASTRKLAKLDSREWYNQLLIAAGEVFKSLKIYRNAVNSRFATNGTGPERKANQMLHEYADEVDRIVCEACSFGYALAGIDAHANPANIPPHTHLTYWPQFPFKHGQQFALTSYLRKNVSPLMHEVLPHILDENIARTRAIERGRRVVATIPASLDLADVLWALQTLRSISGCLAGAIKDGKISSANGIREFTHSGANTNGKVLFLSRAQSVHSGPLAGQARISFQVKPFGYPSAFNIRFDYEASGDVVLDIGSCDLTKAMAYSTALSGRPIEARTFSEKYILNELPPEAPTTEDSSAPRKRLQVATEEQTLAYVTACLSNLGYLTTLRQNTLVSHHHPLATTSQISAQEFSSIVHSIRAVFLAQDKKA